VVITAENPLVRKDLTSSEARIQADQIQKMAVQEVDDILNMQAGITRDADGDLHIRGGRSSEISYMVNGISITDDFYREQALTIENESVQELQVISGTFNAEYGNAMSGVINIVTKDGSNNFTAKLEAWTGDYLSNRTSTFWNIDDVNPAADYNFQGTISGPIVKDRLTFFFTGTRLKTDGWLYGPNAFSPQGRFQLTDGQFVFVRGDSSPVAMNAEERWSGQGALKWKISGPLSLKIDFLGSDYDNGWYTHTYRLNPNGRRTANGYGATVISKLTHVLGQNTFYETTVSYKKNENNEQLYDDPFDARYVHPDSLTAGANSFFKAGTDLFREKRVTKSLIGKFDFTSQVTQRHQVKAGVEFQRDVVDFEDMTLVPATDENGLQIFPFQPEIQATSSGNHNLFRRKPEKFAAYMQDKIEYQSVVINIGLRFDYFNSNGKLPADPQDPNIYNPLKLSHIYKDTNNDGVISLAEQTIGNEYSLEERKTFWYNAASAKVQLSPRVGIAYPITDAGVIHFSYGIFQQIPEYSQLYEDDEIKLSEGQGISGPFGNPDLNPQRTTMYELGLKQQISENIGIDITGFYRDIRDWISTSPAIPTNSTGISYSKTINRDFANVKGFTVTLIRRLSRNYGFNFDYTYQIIKGTNSSPEDEYFALTTGAEPTKQLAPLDWDQRHAVNFNLYYSRKSWGGNLISRYQSGQPYTPEVVAGTLTGQNVIAGLATNTRLKPNRFTVDLNAYKEVNFDDVNLEFFVRIFNLFDGKNPTDVFTIPAKLIFRCWNYPEQSRTQPGLTGRIFIRSQGVFKSAQGYIFRLNLKR
jgi:outer membrane receptor for ferrienterochelin and colicin